MFFYPDSYTPILYIIKFLSNKSEGIYTMKLCIIDVETTGLDVETDRVIEIGAILYSVDSRCSLQYISSLFPCAENKAEHINKIKVSACSDPHVKESTNQVLNLLREMISISDYLVAHNAGFDKKWLKNLGQGKDWLCTYDDFVWPNNPAPSNLVTTCLNHGIGVLSVHRAISDCQMISQLFDRMTNLPELVDQAISRSQEPKINLIATISYDDRDFAKEQGFRWDNTIKKWIKTLRLSEYNSEKENYKFAVQVVA
jgi:DNA polymerase-3 subunit epsilon